MTSAHMITSHHIGSGRQPRRTFAGTMRRMPGAPATEPDPARAWKYAAMLSHVTSALVSFGSQPQ
ncbi:hypothetical protein [Candidatus Amarobacter glycogenicus]|uniref:hypothetical protein n=1 Tax=Candidatus Amarobacter glycogenicus TaxID=3140699 RepID=UPI0031CC9516